MDLNERLILLVTKFRPIYDASHDDYKNTGLKNKLWRKIGKELGVGAELAKNKWKYLRDYYVRNKFVKGRVGELAKNDTWIYMNQMRFLENFIDTPRSRKRRAAGATDEGSDRSASPQPSPCPTSPLNHDPLIIMTRSTNEDPPDNTNQCDAVDHLFLSYAATFKKLAHQNQIKIKLQLANLFAEVEFAEIEQHTPTAYVTTKIERIN